jgi:hypothetical protein
MKVLPMIILNHCYEPIDLFQVNTRCVKGNPKESCNKKESRFCSERASKSQGLFLTKRNLQTLKEQSFEPN